MLQNIKNNYGNSAGFQKSGRIFKQNIAKRI